MATIPIVVVTPVKNESWILDQFLSVTETFADAIIVADQFSTDNSCEIVEKYSKAVLIKNPNPEYDEDFRQKLLLQKARELYPGKKCILALDADEIATAVSLRSTFWQSLDDYAPGTILTFEKPDVLFPVTKCIRHSEFFKLGYIDDGAPHVGRKFHSVRVPYQTSSPIVAIEGVKFMHFALARPKEYRARQRLYSVTENLNKNSNFYQRLISYSPRVTDYLALQKVTSTPEDWFDGWDARNIPLKTIPTSDSNLFNIQTLQHILNKQPSQFYFDDIWDLDWKQFAKDQGSKEPSTIPPVNRFVLNAIIEVLKWRMKLVRWLN